MFNTDNLNQDGLNQDPKNGANGVNESPNQNSDEKKSFTQEDVDRIVSNRISKEREKYKDYDDLKSKVSDLEKTKQDYESLKTKYETSETALSDVLISLSESISDDKKSLIPEQLSTLDKIKYINKNRNVLISNEVKPEKPNIPKDENPKGQDGLINGKYTSLSEFANKDPKGYLIWRKENP